MNLLSQLQTYDAHLLEIIRSNFIIDQPWFKSAILLISDSEPIVFALLLVSLWVYAWYRRENTTKYVALDLFWHVIGALAFYWLLNHFLPIRPRPETVSNIAPLISHIPDNSFPSGHAIFFGASWWALVKLTQWKKTIYFFFFLGVATVTSRVLAGIHYPGDIIVGFVLGLGFVQIILLLPYGKIYRKYGQDMIIKLAGKIKL